MVTRDPRKILEKLDAPLMGWLEAAIRFATSRTHYEVTLEHLLVKLLESGAGDVSAILRRYRVDERVLWDGILARLEHFRSGNAGRPGVSPMLLEILERAWLVASLHHGQSTVRSGNIIEAILATDALRLEPFMDPLSAVSEEELRSHLLEIVAGSSENALRPHETHTQPVTDPLAPAGESALDLYTVDLTNRARLGEIDPVFGRDAEIRQIIDILSRRRKNNPVLVGEAGVGKTAVVEGLAMRIAHADVPDSLTSVEIRSLDLGLLQAGAGMKGEFENRLKSVIRQVRESPRPIILFIDEAHTLIGAGGAAGTSDAANLLKPALARGELRTIAATTWSEYKKYFERDAALERRFQMVKIDEPSIEVATTILRGIKSIYERHHGVQIPDDTVTATVKLAARFITGRQLPDKAVDLLDTACARVRMAQTTKPAMLDDIERRIRDIDIHIEALERDAAAGLSTDSDAVGAMRNAREELDAQRVVLTDRWTAEADLARRIVELRQAVITSEARDLLVQPGDEKQIPRSLRSGRDDTKYDELTRLRAELAALQADDPLVHVAVDAGISARVVADWTGIPVGSMVKDERARLLEIGDRLEERILGQSAAIGELADMLRIGKAGIANPDAPLGVFLLVGPSGVGKTECARAVADLLLGGERFLVTINMSEYQESHTVSQLKGSPPGYVGYGEGGVLTEAVRQRPYSVVLLDEVEKAHADVLTLFYQVFDKGFMRDGEGREIDFKNTIIIMTSNIGSSEFHDACDPARDRPTPDDLRDVSRGLLSRRFPPGLLGRMRVVPFFPLARDTMRRIVRLKLDRVGKRIAQAHAVTFVHEAAVVDWITDRCTEIEAGARNVDAIIDRTVLPEVSRALVLRSADASSPSTLTLGLGDAGRFTYTFSEADAPVAAPINPPPLALSSSPTATRSAELSVP